MPKIHVCSLQRLDATAHNAGASHVLTLMKNTYQVATPACIAPDRHLKLEFSDIVELREGEIAPAAEHVEQLIDFVKDWDRSSPMVVHCYAGVSRSTAGAFIASCLLMPERSEQEIAAHIRQQSPTATPNIRLIAFADAIMGRDGRMVAAIEAIGRGQDCFEGVPFHIDIRQT